MGKGSTMVNLDTHIVVFAFNEELSTLEQTAMLEQDWAICPMVLRELTYLVENHRLDFPLYERTFQRFLNDLSILPISFNVARTSATLDFHSDPADELIAATSIVYGIPLVTRDRTIRQSKLVPLAT